MVCRDDSLVDAGWASTQGRRFYNEDAVYCEFRPMPSGGAIGNTSQVACLGVFDGHGGAAAAKYVRDNIFDVLLSSSKFEEDLFHAVEEAFVKTDLAYLEHDEKVKNDDGCTGTMAVIVGERLVVAHVGDSRAIMGDHGHAVALTEDHKPNRPDERQRIEDIGGTVVHAGTWRVGGILAVSRGFGNRYMKNYIVAKPQIREDKLHAKSDCLIIASDGVWDVVSNEEAVHLVSAYSDAEAAARDLVALAYDRGSYDNISCIVVQFHFGDSHVRKSQKTLTKSSSSTASTEFSSNNIGQKGFVHSGPVRILDTAYQHVSQAAIETSRLFTSAATGILTGSTSRRKE